MLLSLRVFIPITTIIITFSFSNTICGQSKYVINDFNFYPTPSMEKPPKGIEFEDPVFHTKIVRITDAVSEIPPAKRVSLYHGYPKHDIENAHGTKLIMQSWSGPSAWHIWNANAPWGKYMDIPYSAIGKGRPIDCRWDYQKPNVFYFQMQSKFWKYDIVTKQATMLYDFSRDIELPAGMKLGSVGVAEEGTPSIDSRYWAFKVVLMQGSSSRQGGFLVYDKDFYGKDQGKIISRLDPSHPNFRTAGFISMSPCGNYVWIGDNGWLYSRDFQTVRKVNLRPGHADFAMSAEGRWVIFGFHGNVTDPIPPGYSIGGYWAAMEDVETGILTRLTPIGRPYYHFSGNAYDKPGWGVVSQNRPIYPKVEEYLYDHEVFTVELTTRKAPPPKVWRLAKTHTVRKGYSDDIYAKFNKKGTKIWFGTGWNKSFYDPGASYDVYQINLPSTWYQDLSSSVFFPTTEPHLQKK